MTLARLRMLAQTLVLLTYPSTYRNPYPECPRALDAILASVPDAETPERIAE